MMLNVALAAVVAFHGMRVAPTAEPVVSVSWLKQHLADRDLVILQFGSAADFQAGRIPGARDAGLGVERQSADAGGKMDMSAVPALADLKRNLESLGVSNSSHVILSYTGSGAPAATRAAFALRYAGLENVSVLDGGIDAWRRAGYPMTQAQTAPSVGTFEVRLQPALLADRDYVQAHRSAAHARIVDAREAEAFNAAGRGHIPGATSLPFNTLLDDNNALLTPQQLAARFTAAGIQPSDTVIAYCHSGVLATVVTLAARLTGHPTRLYVGSFRDWSNHQLPTEGGQ